MDGWIKLYRKILDWEFYTDVKTFKLWLHLLITCNIVPEKRAYGYTLKPGQLITKLPKLAAETGLSEKEIRTALSKLEKGRQITQERTNKFRLITLENWDFYQGLTPETGRQRADKTKEAGRQRASLNQEVKEYKKKNIYKLPPSANRNRFINYPQSEWDFEEIERKERELRLSDL